MFGEIMYVMVSIINIVWIVVMTELINEKLKKISDDVTKISIMLSRLNTMIIPIHNNFVDKK